MRRNQFGKNGRNLSSQASYDEEEVGRRLLFAMVIDAYKCLDSGVLQEPKDADILGLGFPHTGGVMSYIDYIGQGICLV
jgi:3-hydroxyacyl-CoA dehydrogenase/enoyl-CoA hydratase/3-hydroxybutyryl-CoA epimerase